MKGTIRWTGLALVLALAVGACGKNGPTGADQGLTGAEIDSLALILAEYSVQAVPSGLRDRAPQPGIHLLADTTTTSTVSDSLSCPNGGYATMDGSYTRTDADSVVTVDGDLTETPVGCVVPVASSTLTLDGAPALQLTSHLVRVNASVDTLTFGLTGSFSWQRASGGEGTCDIDLSSDADVATYQLSVNGTLCGRTISMQAYLLGG
ncbi:MAG: hypothetical protein P8099_15090 [Gemmatimonadota bacterium]